MASSAGNNPADIEPTYVGQVRHADGYQYWATSEEDEEGARNNPVLAATPAASDKPAPQKRRRAGRNMSLVLLVMIAALLTYYGVSLFQVWSAADDDQTQEADAIVVLGAAQFDGTPSPVFAARLDHAFALWESGQAPLIITTGSKQEGDRFTEGFAGYVYLREKGVPDEALIPIVDGGDTWEQLSASANQIIAREIGPVLLVSDGYHNYRLLAIADEVGIEAYVSPTTVEPTFRNYAREAAAVSIGRVFGYRRLSGVTSE